MWLFSRNENIENNVTFLRFYNLSQIRPHPFCHMPNALILFNKKSLSIRTDTIDVAVGRAITVANVGVVSKSKLFL